MRIEMFNALESDAAIYKFRNNKRYLEISLSVNKVLCLMIGESTKIFRINW